MPSFIGTIILKNDIDSAIKACLSVFENKTDYQKTVVLISPLNENYYNQISEVFQTKKISDSFQRGKDFFAFFLQETNDITLRNYILGNFIEGDYFGFLSEKSIYSPTKIQRSLDSLQDPFVGFVYNDNTNNLYSPFDPAIPELHKNVKNTIFKREIVEDIGVFENSDNPELNLMLRAMPQYMSIHIPEVLDAQIQ